jgi:hypothetical protein
MMDAGLSANKAGDYVEARKLFRAAFDASGTASAQISAANMALKLGMDGIAMNEYALALEARRVPVIRISAPLLLSPLLLALLGAAHRLDGEGS